MLLAPLRKLFKPAVKTPAQKLQETRAMLAQWIFAGQVELETSDDELWNMGQRDSINAWKAQIDQIEHLLAHPEICTAQGLENLLREKFRVYNELDASLAALPAFDEDEDELDYESMTSTERIQRKSVKRYHDRQFVIHHQLNLIARFAGVSERRIHDVLHILTAHYTPVEDRLLRKNEKAASWYPVIRAWMDREDTGSIKDLVIPVEFSHWMPEHQSPFPTLV